MMRRLSATIVLAGLAAFALLPRLAGNWVCPDGTPCRYVGGATFECVSCLSPSPQKAPPCCPKKRPAAHRCPHGLLPVRVRVSSSQPARFIAAEDTCRCQFVPAHGNRLNAGQPKSFSLNLLGETPVLFVHLLRFSPQSEFLSPEDDSIGACEGLAPPPSRAPPLGA